MRSVRSLSAGEAFGLPLPSYARPDLAFTDTFTLPNSSGFPGFNLTVTGQYFEIVQSISFTMATDATVINRGPFLVLSDPNGNVMGRIPFPAIMTASQTVQATYSTAQVATTAPVVGVSVIAMPTWLLWPGAVMVQTCGNGQPGDTVTGITITRVRIPTGPPSYSVLDTVSIPTPILF